MANDIADRAQKARDRFHTQAQRIREDQDLSREGKRRQLAKAYVEARDQVEELRQEAQGKRQATKHKTRKSVFGIDDLASSKDGGAAVSYRDAQDRAAAIERQDEASRLLSRAQTAGDELLARAIAARAVEVGWREVVSTYGEENPKWAEAAASPFWHTEQSRSERLAESMALSMPKPRELEDLTGSMVDSFAAGRR